MFVNGAAIRALPCNLNSGKKNILDGFHRQKAMPTCQGLK